MLFDHGHAVALSRERVKPFYLAVGDCVLGRWQGGGDFYPGMIVALDGEIVHIRFDDGDEEDTTIRLIRLQRDDWLPDPGVHELAQGNRIFGRWFDGFWYPGVILGIEGKKLHILFDDNDQAHLSWDQVRPLEFESGARVFCRFKGGPYYFPEEITKKQGERIHVSYDDGQTEWTSIRVERYGDWQGMFRRVTAALNPYFSGDFELNHVVQLTYAETICNL